MAILPNDLTTSTTITASEVQGNDAALEAVLDGGITQLNMDSSTRIPNSYLANNDFDVVLTAAYTELQLNDMTATDGTKLLMVGSVPYDSGSTALSAYTVSTVETATFLNGGATAGTTPIFKLQIGNPTDGWSDITNATGITWGSTNNTARVTVGTALSGANYSSRAYYLALRPTTAAAGYLADPVSSFSLSVKLKRELRS